MNSTGQNRGMAITSMVLGIFSMVCLGLITGIPAIITGHIAHGRARKMPEQFGGAGMAIAGFVMGYMSLLITALVVAIVLPALDMAKGKAESVKCVNNMKQIGLSFRLWAGDNQDEFPFNVSTAQGGTKERCDRGPDGDDANAYLHFQVMSNELSTPKILVCPADTTKTPAMDFQSLQAANVSYIARSGPNVSENNPQEILVRCPIHSHILRCDSSVERGDGR